MTWDCYLQVLKYLWLSIYLPNRNKYSRPSQVADYIDESLSISDPRTFGFSLADLPASLSIVWVVVWVSDVVSNNRIFSSVKTHALELCPTLLTRELVSALVVDSKALYKRN